MWKLTSIDNPTGLQLWFSDGQTVDDVRGGFGASSRLIVSTQGFIDITDGLFVINLNNLTISTQLRTGKATLDIDSTYELKLFLPGDGTFVVELQTSTVSLDYGRTQVPGNPGPFPDPGPLPLPSPVTVERLDSGKFKPIPSVSHEDVDLLSSMIKDGHVPYPDIPEAPGKPIEEITRLGKQFFPFSRDSLELAIAVYDWTTASFARMVFMRIFEYTSIPPQPFPLDKPSIAKAIWDSDWPPYTPSNEPYMSSFLMKPSDSLEDVAGQLEAVARQLHDFALAENHILAVAALSLPRTSVLSVPQLFSGQPDISQLTLSQFGVEFLEFSGNEGPVDRSLEIELATAMKDYIKPGSIITTKMIWSFADTREAAEHYSNGLLLVCNPPDRTWVWDAASYVTILSDDPKKNEYVFPPGSSFLVQSIETEKYMTVITLMSVLPDKTVSPQPETAEYIAASAILPALPPPVAQQPVPRKYVPYNHVHEGKTNGRWCHCVRDHLERNA